jgi:large subunit ribosomal protein L17
MRGRQLSVDSEHRLAIRRNMAQSLFEHGRIQTTLPKAKEVQGFAEKLITLARVGTLTARRRVIAALNDRRVTDENQDFILNEKGNPKTVVQRLFDEVAPRYTGRPGGYTRIIKTAKWRIGDAGNIVILEMVSDEAAKPTGTVRRSAGLRRKRMEKRQQFASTALKQRKSGGEAPATEAPATDAPADNAAE